MATKNGKRFGQVAAMLGVLLSASMLLATESARTFVYLKPETSSFWRTARGSRTSVPIDFPEGAASATLSVKGARFSESHAITSGTTSFDLVLPEPTKPGEENVYDLTLAFDNGVTRTARLGMIEGLSSAPGGRTRCLAPASGKAWGKVSGRAVIPVPYGATSLTVNGVAVDPGLGGAQGWYLLDGLTHGHDALLTLAVDDVSYEASLVGGSCGLLLIIR